MFRRFLCFVFLIFARKDFVNARSDRETASYEHINHTTHKYPLQHRRLRLYYENPMYRAMLGDFAHVTWGGACGNLLKKFAHVASCIEIFWQ